MPFFLVTFIIVVFELMQEEFEDTKVVIRIRKSKKDRPKEKGQTTIYKTLQIKYRSSNTNSTKTGGEIRCSGRVSSSCFTCDTCRVTIVTNPGISNEWEKEREVLTTSGSNQSLKAHMNIPMYNFHRRNWLHKLTFSYDVKFKYYILRRLSEIYWLIQIKFFTRRWWNKR